MFSFFRKKVRPKQAKPATSPPAPVESTNPTRLDFEELVSFLPRLYADGFVPIKAWHGGVKDKDGVTSFPWPEYDELVKDFFAVASKDCWRDHRFPAAEASLILKDEDALQSADLVLLKKLLTCCVRGERFCDGLWGTLIEEGDIRRLLQRIAQVGLQTPDS